MTDSVMFSKEKAKDTRQDGKEQTPSDYYYDDSTGYRIYDAENEDDETEDESEED